MSIMPPPRSTIVDTDIASSSAAASRRAGESAIAEGEQEAQKTGKSFSLIQNSKCTCSIL